MSSETVPFLDLVTAHRELREELLAVFTAALDTAGFVGGPMVQQFERDFAEFCKSRFCIGTARASISSISTNAPTPWIPRGCAPICRRRASATRGRATW